MSFLHNQASRIRVVAAGIVIGALAACQPVKMDVEEVLPSDSSAVMGSEVAELVQLMSGSFSSKAQSERARDFYDIHLYMAPIWVDDSSREAWLYVEQAAASALDQPYRQRVYRLAKQGNGYVSYVYTIADPAAQVGKWREPQTIDAAVKDTLQLRAGCEVYLRRTTAGHYLGGTDGTGCSSSLRGATYATSVVKVTPASIVSWDQGFDVGGTQVWGAVTGPYVFDRVSN